MADLSYFEDSDGELARVEEAYRKGDLLTGELKKMAITLLQAYVGDFQERRKHVTDETMRAYMTPRRLAWAGNPNPKMRQKATKEPTKSSDAGKKQDVDAADKLNAADVVTRMEEKVAGTSLS